MILILEDFRVKSHSYIECAWSQDSGNSGSSSIALPNGARLLPACCDHLDRLTRAAQADDN